MTERLNRSEPTLGTKPQATVYEPRVGTLTMLNDAEFFR